MDTRRRRRRRKGKGQVYLVCFQFPCQRPIPKSKIISTLYSNKKKEKKATYLRGQIPSARDRFLAFLFLFAVHREVPIEMLPHLLLVKKSQPASGTLQGNVMIQSVHHVLI